MFQVNFNVLLLLVPIWLPKMTLQKTRPTLTIDKSEQCGAQYYCVGMKLSFSTDVEIFDSGNTALYVLTRTYAYPKVDLDAIMVLPLYMMMQDENPISIMFEKASKLEFACFAMISNVYSPAFTAIKGNCYQGDKRTLTEVATKERSIWIPDLEKDIFMFCFRTKVTNIIFECYTAIKTDEDISDKTVKINYEEKVISSHVVTEVASSYIKHTFENVDGVRKHKITFQVTVSDAKVLSNADVILVRVSTFSAEQMFQVRTESETSSIKASYFNIPKGTKATLKRKNTKIYLKPDSLRSLSLVGTSQKSIDAENSKVFTGENGSDEKTDYIEFHTTYGANKATFYIIERIRNSGYHEITKYGGTGENLDKIEAVDIENFKYKECTTVKLVQPTVINTQTQNDVLTSITFSLTSSKYVSSAKLYTCNGNYTVTQSFVTHQDDCYNMKLTASNENLHPTKKCSQVILELHTKPNVKAETFTYDVVCTGQTCSLTAYLQFGGFLGLGSFSPELILQRQYAEFRRNTQREFKKKAADTVEDIITKISTPFFNKYETKLESKDNATHKFDEVEKMVTSVQSNVSTEDVTVMYFPQTKEDFKIVLPFSNKKPATSADDSTHPESKTNVEVSGGLVQTATGVTVSVYHLESKTDNVLASPVVVVDVDAFKPHDDNSGSGETAERKIVLKFNITTPRTKKKLSCAWIKGDMKNFKNDGCNTSYRLNPRNPVTEIQCTCNHLTSFAVLFDYTKVYRSRMNLDLFPQISLIVTSISIFALLLVIMRYMFKSKAMATYEILYLAMNYLFLYATLIFATKLNVIDVHCSLIKYATVFCVLQTYATLMLLGYRVYKNLTPSSISLNWILTKRGLLIPPVVALLWMGPVILGSIGDESLEMCLLSSHDQNTFILPVFLITMIFNIYALVSSYLYTRRNNFTLMEAREQNVGVTRRVVVCLTIVLGLTWLLQLFLPETRVFECIFIILNGSHGIILFLCVSASSIQAPPSTPRKIPKIKWPKKPKQTNATAVKSVSTFIPEMPELTQQIREDIEVPVDEYIKVTDGIPPELQLPVEPPALPPRWRPVEEDPYVVMGGHKYYL